MFYLQLKNIQKQLQFLYIYVLLTTTVHKLHVTSPVPIDIGFTYN